MMRGNDHALVIGAGVVGLSAALALHDAGISVSLVAPSKQSKPLSNAPKRMYAIHLGSESFFRSLGVWSDVLLKSAAAYRSIMVWEDVPEQLIFDAKTLGKPYLGHIVNEEDLLKTLWQGVEKREAMTVHEGEVVSLDVLSGSVTLNSGQSFSADLVVGADGAGSSIRKLGDFACEQKSYGQIAIVATIRHEHVHHQRLIQRFLPNGPVALLALQDPHESSLVWTMSTTQAEAMQQYDDQAFGEALTEALQFREGKGGLGKCQVLDARHEFPLWQRHVQSYYKEKVVLVGDAAHTVHPLAGQGLNLGLMDVRHLAEVLTKARARSWGLSDKPSLRQWSRDCHAENAKKQAAFSGINALFASQNTCVNGFRQMGMAVMHRLPIFRRAVMRVACAPE